MATSVEKICPQCGTHLAGASSVEGLCSACLLSVALEEGRETTPSPAAWTRGARLSARPRELHPADSGVVPPTWAMPAELLRQAANRLRLAAVGLGLFFAGSIVANNLIEVAGWHSFANAALRNMLAASMVTLSAGMVWLAHSGRLTPARLLRVSLGFEIAVSLGISLHDHLEPLGATRPSLVRLVALRLDRDLPPLRARVAAVGLPRRGGVRVHLAARLLRRPGPGQPGGASRRPGARLPRELHRRRRRHVRDGGDQATAGARVLPARGEARPRRDGRDLACAPPHAGPAGRGEDDPPRADRR